MKRHGSLIGIAGLATLFLTAGISSATAATCNVEREIAVVSSIFMNGGMDAQTAAAGFANVPDNRVTCRVEAMVLLATSINPASTSSKLDMRSCENGLIISRSGRRERQTVVLETLAQLALPWSVSTSFTERGDLQPASPKQKAMLERLGLAIVCADHLLAQTSGSTQRETLRAYRGAAEIAHANGQDGYYSLLAAQQVECASARNKASAARRNQKITASEFAIKAILVEISASITAATITGCDIHEDAIEALLARIQSAFTTRLPAKSIEGWRWVNDLLAVEAILAIAKGDKLRASAAIEKLDNLGSVASGPGYAGLVHPEAKKRLREIDAERAETNIPPYEDQVFYQRPIPGMTLGNVVVERPYHSNTDIAVALRSALRSNKKPCRDNCLKLLRDLDKTVRDNLNRSDLSVVAGSYLESSGALRGLQSICKRLAKEGIGQSKSCDFKTMKLGSYHRISTEPMDEKAARELAGALGDRKIDHFLSRPRIIDPL